MNQKLSDTEVAQQARDLGYPALADLIDGSVVRIRKTDLDELLADVRRLNSENDRLREAMSGWRDHYGWKNGVYIDNVNDVFHAAIGIVQ